MAYFDIKYTEIDIQSNDVLQYSKKMKCYIDKVISIKQNIEKYGQGILMDTYELDKIIATMMIEGSQLYILGNKLSEITKLYHKSEEKLTQPIESDYKKAGIDNTASEIMKELKKQNGMITTLLRLQEEMREEGNIATANGIEELISEVKKEGINKFMENHKNKLTGCVVYTSNTGIKFSIDTVKIYDDNDITARHKQDAGFVAGIGLIPTVGTFAGPLAGILCDEQQNNPEVVENLKINSIGSMIGNAGMLEKKIPIPKLGSIGTIGSAAWTAITTGKGMLNEQRTTYIEEIDNNDGEKQYIPLHSGVVLVNIRCADNDNQKTIRAYIDDGEYLAYNEYSVYGRYS